MPKCDKYKFELKKPCSCEKCSYHLNREVSFNCLLYYLNHEDTSISITDASHALNLSRSQYKDKVKSAIDESRASKLDEVIGRGNEFEYVENSDICIVCGKDCEVKKLKFGGIAYCSKKCHDTLPPKIASLMNKLGIDEYTLLYALIAVFSGVKICEFLEVDAKFLKSWIKRLTGLKIKEIRDIAPLQRDLSLEKIQKISVKNRGNSLIFNNDPVFEKVDCFLAM